MIGNCIYFTTSKEKLTFESKEHIIPAGIGGIQRLLKGVVSDQANKIFSNLELDFMRNSLISIPRQFYSPRIRRSKIHIIFNLNEDNFPQLGYHKGGIPYIIPQFFICKTGESTFSVDYRDNNYELQLNNFINKLSSYNNEYIFIQEIKLKNNFIFGYFEDKWFFSSSQESTYNNAIKYIDVIKQGNIKNLESKESMFKAKAHIKLSYDSEKFDRVCGKIVFNFLCYSKGVNFVLNSRFDPIRSWILNGGKNNFVFPYDPENKNAVSKHLNIDYPNLSHKIFLFNGNDYLMGILSFYGSYFKRIIKLCSISQKELIYDGFICDWKNRSEISLYDYLKKINNEGEKSPSLLK